MRWERRKIQAHYNDFMTLEILRLATGLVLVCLVSLSFAGSGQAAAGQGHANAGTPSDLVNMEQEEL
jgi:hypothetical protein